MLEVNYSSATLSSFQHRHSERDGTTTARLGSTEVGLTLHCSARRCRLRQGHALLGRRPQARSGGDGEPPAGVHQRQPEPVWQLRGTRPRLRLQQERRRLSRECRPVWRPLAQRRDGDLRAREVKRRQTTVRHQGR